MDKMEVLARCLCTVFLVLSLVCDSVTGLYCSNDITGYQYYCRDDYECCHIGECCFTGYYVYQLWWFWFIWFVVFCLIACCIIAMRRRRNRLQYIRVAQPAYGTTPTAYPPPAGAYQYPQHAPSAPVNPPQYTQPQKPPPYQ